MALRNGEIRIVQSSMLGSILSNILLVLGCCFLAGGIHNTRTGTAEGIQQDFNSTVASTMSSLMVVASASLIIPATVSSSLTVIDLANISSSMLLSQTLLKTPRLIFSSSHTAQPSSSSYYTLCILSSNSAPTHLSLTLRTQKAKTKMKKSLK